jgi:hypothetical protein
VDLCGSGYGSVAGSREHDNGPSGWIIENELLSDCQLFEEDFSSCS